MAVYNSHIDSIEDDISIINPSIGDENVDNTYVPIITRLKQANHSYENRQTTNSETHNNNHAHPSDDNDNSYIFVDHDPLKNAKQLEEVVISYIRDLKQESNTQLDCDKQLVTRLMNLIRPAYSNNQEKMIQLDKIVEEIGQLHDKRHIDQKEKIEHYRAEISRLNRMIFTANNDQTIYNDNTKNYSMFSTLQQGYSSTDYEQWTEIEGDAKKLQELVESQRKQINEIVSLISETAAASVSNDQPKVPIHNAGDVTTGEQPPPSPNQSAINNLYERIRKIAGSASHQPQPPVKTARLPDTTLINNSPGTSPTQSLNTLTLSTMTPTINEPHKEHIQELETSVEKPHKPIDIPVPSSPPPPPPAPISAVETKKCPVCNYEFPPTSDDVEMYDHIEKCLFPTGAAVEPKDYECPNCNRKYPGNDDSAYLQHLSDCYNREF